MKRSIYDAAFATSQPEAKKFNNNDDVHSQLLKMIILGGRGDYHQQHQHQELGGNNTIRHHQLLSRSYEVLWMIEDQQDCGNLHDDGMLYSYQ